MNTDTEKFKNALKEEQEQLEKELSMVGRVNPQNPKDWELKPMEQKGTEPEFRDDTVDNMEEMDERAEIELSLEQRYRNVVRALEKIDSQQYGACEICQTPIELSRLEANPAARTCITHREEGERLPN